MAWLVRALALVGCGGDPAPEASRCAWFQACGVGRDGASCGACDDGDPCTVDACVGAGVCTHRTASDACACTPRCDASDGTPRAVQAVRQGDGGVAGLESVRAVAATADGAQVFVGGLGGGIALYVRDDAGALRLAATTPSGAVRALALFGGDRWLAAVGDGLAVYRRDTEGALTEALAIPGTFDGLSAPWPDGRRVVATSGGALVPLEDAGDAVRVGDPVVLDDLAGARHLVVAPDGRFAYAAAFDRDQLVILSGDTLAVVERVGGVPGLRRPDALALSADGAYLAVGGFCDSALAVFARDAASGGLSLLGAYQPSLPEGECPEADDGVTFNRPTAIAALAEPGHFAVLTAQRGVFPLYAARWTGAAVEVSGPAQVSAWFDGGRLSFVTAPEPPLGPPDPYEFRGVTAVAPAGDALVAVSGMSATLGVLAPDAGGLVHRVQRGDEGGALGLACAVRLALGGDVLAVAQRCNPEVGFLDVDARGNVAPRAAVRVPDAAPSDGAEAVVALPDGAFGVTVTSLSAPGLAVVRPQGAGVRTALPDCGDAPAFPVGIAASPAGDTVFVADFHRGATSCVHSARRESDALTPAAVLLDERLAGAESLVVTRDGASVLVACHGARAVTELTVGVDGSLSVRSSTQRPELEGAEFLALGPEDRTVAVTSPVTSSVVLFDRDPASGTLTHRATVGRDDGLPLWGAAGVLVSPDGRFVTVAARADDALVTLDAEQGLALHTALSDVGEWPNGLAQTADGAHLFVAAVRSSSVTAVRVQRSGDDGCLGRCP